MKEILILIFVTISTTFIASKFLFDSKNLLQSQKINYSEIKDIRSLIVNDLNTKEELNLNNIFASSSLFSNSLNINVIFDKFFDNNNVDCDTLYSPTSFELNSQTKSLLWKTFLCKKIDFLSERFFETAPYLNNFGSSYAFLAYKTNKKQYTNTNWIYNHLRYFKISELRLIKNFKLPQPYLNFSKLTKAELMFIETDSDFFTLRNFVFLKKKPKKNFLSNMPFNYHQNGAYKLASFSMINKFIENSPYQIKLATNNSKCIFKEDNICWNYKFGYLFTLINKTALVFFIFAIILIVIAIRQFILKQKQSKQLEDQRKLALQILSHEFRTPISSLLLLNDSILKKIKEIKPEIQNDFYEMSSNIYRLQRLTEMSKNYLKVSEKGNIVNNPVIVSSLQDLIEDIVFRYSDNGVTLNSNSKDINVLLDTYWLQTCLKNLIENAISHGKKPITLDFQITNSNLVISVQDSGTGEIKPIDKLVSEFTKGSKSVGTGLGLSIVYKIMHELGGELQLKQNPTTFKLIFKNIEQKGV